MSTLLLVVLIGAAPGAYYRGSQKAFRAFQSARAASEQAAAQQPRTADVVAAELDRVCAALEAAETGRVDRRSTGNPQWHSLPGGRYQATFQTPQGKAEYLDQWRRKSGELLDELLFLLAPEPTLDSSATASTFAPRK